MVVEPVFANTGSCPAGPVPRISEMKPSEMSPAIPIPNGFAQLPTSMYTLSSVAATLLLDPADLIPNCGYPSTIVSDTRRVFAS